MSYISWAIVWTRNVGRKELQQHAAAFRFSNTLQQSVETIRCNIMLQENIYIFRLMVIRGPTVRFIIGPHPGHNGLSASRSNYKYPKPFKGTRLAASRWMWFPLDQRGMRAQWRAACRTYDCVTVRTGVANSWTCIRPGITRHSDKSPIITFHYTVVTGSCLSLAYYR
jgi:hypothetical protein